MTLALFVLVFDLSLWMRRWSCHLLKWGKSGSVRNKSYSLEILIVRLLFDIKKIIKAIGWQDAGVKGCKLTSYYKNTKKSQLTAERPSKNPTGTYQKDTLHPKTEKKSQQRRYSRVLSRHPFLYRGVGGAQSWQNQIPHLPGGWPTNWKLIILQKFPHRIEGPEPHVRLPSLVVWQWEEEPPENLVLKVSGV